MAITYIDPAQGGLGQAIGELLSAGADKLNEKNIREKNYESDPAQMQSLAAAYRAAESAGQGNIFLEAINVRPEFGVKLKSFQPTSGERLEVARNKAGVPEIQARSEAATGQVQAETGEAQIAARLPQMLVDRDILSATYESQSFEELLNRNIPFLSALGQEQDFRTSISKGRYEGSYYDILNENGQARLVANAERSKALLGIKADDVQSRAIDRYVEGVNSIDQSTPEGKDLAFRANAYIANPGFASFLANRDEMDFRIRLAEQTNTPNPVETIKLGLDIQDKLDTRLKTYHQLVDDGAEKEEIAAAGQAINNLASLAKDLGNAGVILPFDVTSYDVKMGLVPERFTSDLVRKAATDFTNELFKERTTPIPEKIQEVESAISQLDDIARANKWTTGDKREMGIFLTETLTKLKEDQRLEKLSSTKRASEETRINLNKWIQQLNSDDLYEASLKAQLSSPRGGGLR